MLCSHWFDMHDGREHVHDDSKVEIIEAPDRRPRGHYVSFCHCASHVGGNFFATLNAADSSVSKAIFCASMTSPATR